MRTEIAASIATIERELDHLRRLVAEDGVTISNPTSVSLKEAVRRLNSSSRTVMRHAVRDDAATKNGGGRWQIDMCKLSLKVPR